MKKIICILSLVLFTSFVFSDDNILWKEIYSRNYSLCHKLILCRKEKDVNDQLLSQFMIAYLYYRIGNYEDVFNIFKGVDRFLEKEIIEDKLIE